MPFAQYLKGLRVRAGKPSYRQLGRQIGYGRTTVSDAFQGRRLPSWDVTEPLVRELGGDVEEARRRWAVAGGGLTTSTVSAWLVEPVAAVPALPSGVGLAKAAALAATRPNAAIEDGWEVVRMSAVHLSRALYNDLPGNWPGQIVEAFRRAETEGKLLGGASVIAQQLEQIRDHCHLAVPSTELALQYVVSAYRLAYLASSALHGDAPAHPATGAPLAGATSAAASGIADEHEPTEGTLTLKLLAEDFSWDACPDGEQLADFRGFLEPLIAALRDVPPPDRALLGILLRHGNALRIGASLPTYGMPADELHRAAGLAGEDMLGHLATLERHGLVHWPQEERHTAVDWVWTAKRDAHALDCLRSFCLGRELDIHIMIRDLRFDWLG
ncbi:helix-turn-helix domain-containing protein [Streptacidiphilus sp. MAP12-16]|uniref:helix-turn-helix domain-containing protein n=1 Tax=Streptacidiphilus sp. MAP12-16 TaxID=3156300 RepID=UPI003511C302